MKKSQAYVTRGTPTPRERTEWEPPPPVPRAAPSSAMSPADLPRDRGMAGAFGAYEVPPLAKSLGASLQELTKSLQNDPLAEVNAALDALLTPTERQRVTAESFVNGLLTLALARREDRFTHSRFLAPKLRAALQPALGRVTIHFVDR